MYGVIESFVIEWNILLILIPCIIYITVKLTRNRIMIKHLINILLFILFYCVQIVPIAAYSGAYGTIAPIAFGSIICLFTSYFIVKLIRKPKKENKVSGTINITDELMKLHELKEKGILTEEEFTEQKKKLL